VFGGICGSDWGVGRYWVLAWFCVGGWMVRRHPRLGFFGDGVFGGWMISRHLRLGFAADGVVGGDASSLI